MMNRRLRPISVLIIQQPEACTLLCPDRHPKVPRPWYHMEASLPTWYWIQNHTFDRHQQARHQSVHPFSTLLHLGLPVSWRTLVQIRFLGPQQRLPSLRRQHALPPLFQCDQNNGHHLWWTHNQKRSRKGSPFLSPDSPTILMLTIRHRYQLYQTPNQATWILTTPMVRLRQERTSVTFMVEKQDPEHLLLHWLPIRKLRRLRICISSMLFLPLHLLIRLVLGPTPMTKNWSAWNRTQSPDLRGKRSERDSIATLSSASSDGDFWNRHQKWPTHRVQTTHLMNLREMTDSSINLCDVKKVWYAASFVAFVTHVFSLLSLSPFSLAFPPLGFLPSLVWFSFACAMCSISLYLFIHSKYGSFIFSPTNSSRTLPLAGRLYVAEPSHPAKWLATKSSAWATSSCSSRQKGLGHCWHWTSTSTYE